MEATLTHYADIFDVRGQAHDDAFRLYPQACQQEVQAILGLADPRAGETLLDLPAAGGFLSTHLNVPGVNLIAVEPSPQLHQICRRLVPQSFLAPLHALPLADGSVDVAVCLAGLHHEARLAAVFAEIQRVLKKGGRLAIAEVNEGSAEAGFLNGFVHRHSSLGHCGVFANQALVDRLVGAGFRLAQDRMASYHWRFEDRAALADCLRLMFGIDQSTPQNIIEAVEQGLGVDDFSEGGIGMRWSLRHVLAFKD
jgi:SAM-dependent methyltransferase